MHIISLLLDKSLNVRTCKHDPVIIVLKGMRFVIKVFKAVSLFLLSWKYFDNWSTREWNHPSLVACTAKFGRWYAVGIGQKRWTQNKRSYGDAFFGKSYPFIFSYTRKSQITFSWVKVLLAPIQLLISLELCYSTQIYIGNG